MPTTPRPLPIQASGSTARHARLAYLPAVDGMRAIAVLAVMVYHAAPKWLPGGYAGVDVFFVISGYLITRIIVGDLAEGSFSIWRFWERRVRRILPPLLAMLTITALAGWLWFSPSELESFAVSAFASLLSSANIYFWRTSGGYFALATPLMPLLHLWSLGVEEQFYLVYPIIVLIVARARRRMLLPLIVFGLVLSFALAWYNSAYHPVAGFFLPFSRAWELAAGCALALWQNGRAARGAFKAEASSALALIVILASFALVSDATPWPGMATLPVVAASAALIAFAPSARITGALLASRPLVAIGLVSYAAYLWHHPLLSFARIVSPRQIGPTGIIGLLVTSLLVGALSLVLIERPARNRRRLPPRIFWPGIVAWSAILLAATLLLWRSGGAPERLPPRLQRIAAMTEVYPPRMEACFFPPGTTRPLEQGCLRGASGPVRTAIVGDSHAMALAAGFDPLLAETGTRARVLSAAGCQFIDDPAALSALQAHCPAFTRKIMAYLLARRDIPVVVIAARWPYAFARTFYDNGEGGVELGPDEGLRPDAARDRKFEASLRRLVARLREAGKTVVLVYPVPEPGWDVPKYLVHRHLLGLGEQIPTIDEARWRRRAAPAVAMLDRLGEDRGIVRVRPASVTCGHPVAGRCILGANGEPFYFDDDHPNELGARLMIWRAMERQGTADTVRRAIEAGAASSPAATVARVRRIAPLANEKNSSIGIGLGRARTTVEPSEGAMTPPQANA